MEWELRWPHRRRPGSTPGGLIVSVLIGIVFIRVLLFSRGFLCLLLLPRSTTTAYNKTFTQQIKTKKQVQMQKRLQRKVPVPLPPLDLAGAAAFFLVVPFGLPRPLFAGGAAAALSSSSLSTAFTSCQNKAVLDIEQPETNLLAGSIPCVSVSWHLPSLQPFQRWSCGHAWSG